MATPKTPKNAYHNHKEGSHQGEDVWEDGSDTQELFAAAVHGRATPNKEGAIMLQSFAKVILHAALAYAARGWPVFPCNQNNKQPLTKHGFKDASMDVPVITAWWQRWPNAMIGTPTGVNMFCLDLDRKPGGADGVATWQALCAQHGGEPDTLTIETPSTGRHSYFKDIPGSRCIPLDKLAPGLEIKAEGGYAILAPSRMSDGREYRIINEADIAEAPKWLIDKMQAYWSGRGKPNGKSELSEQNFPAASELGIEQEMLTPEQRAKIEEQCEQFAGLGVSLAPWDIIRR